MSVRIEKAGLEPRDQVVLQTARYFFESFANPEHQSWLLGLKCPTLTYGEIDGVRVASLVLGAVQAMRQARQSCFRFNNPHCANCARLLSEHEGLFMRSFIALREGRRPVAFSYAMLLCETNPVDTFLAAQTRLINATDALEMQPMS